MEFVRVLAALRRRWRFLAGGALVAVVLAIALGPPQSSASALGWTRVTLDTPKSQLLESAPKGADTLPWRASLLVHLMGTDEAVARIADRLRVRPDEVFVVDTALAEPQVPASMPASAAEAAAFTVAPYVLTLYVRNPTLPMISIETAAPDRERARRLAEAAVKELEARSSLVEAPYASRIITGGGVALKHQTYLVEAVAPVRTKEVVVAGMPTKQIGVFVLLGFWCVGVLTLPLLFRRRPRPLTA